MNFTEGGKRVLHIRAPMWTTLQQNKRFDGIRLFPRPKPNPDGSYTVTLTVTQWKVFEKNMEKAPIPVPGKPEPAKPAPGNEPKKPAPGEKPEKTEEKPEDKAQDEITVTQEPSMSYILHSIFLLCLK